MTLLNLEKSSHRVALLLTSASLITCRARQTEPAPVPSASAVFDRNANGKLLEQSLAQWSKRWAEVQPLADCAPLLSDAPSLDLCKQAQGKLETMKAAVTNGAGVSALLADAKDLALAAEAANAKLEAALLQRLRERAEEARKVAAAASSSAPPAQASAGGTHRVAWPKTTATPKIDVSIELGQREVSSAYANVSRMAVRYLDGYLIYAPLPIRRSALPVFVELAKIRNWPALRSGIREAVALETDPTQKAELEKLLPPPRSLIRPSPAASASANPG